MTMTVRDAGGSRVYKLLSNGIHNIYNQVTAVAVLRELGMSHEEIGSYLEKTGIVKSRYEAEPVGDVTVVMQMAKEKNALACSRAFDFVSHEPGQKELFLMMNCLGDEKHWSENVCWLYDCDYSALADPSLGKIVFGGPRCKDHYLRAMLAGVDPEKISITESCAQAADLMDLSLCKSVFVLHELYRAADAAAVKQRLLVRVREEEAV